MSKRMRRLLAAVLAVLMLVSIMPQEGMTVMAAGNYNYEPDTVEESVQDTTEETDTTDEEDTSDVEAETATETCETTSEETTCETTEATTEETTEETLEDSMDCVLHTELLDEELIPSAAQYSDRVESWNDFLNQTDSLIPNLDYIDGSFAFEASSKEEASKIASFYNAKLLGYAYGVGEMIFTDMSTVDVMENCMEAVEMGQVRDRDLPSIYPNTLVFPNDEARELRASMLEDMGEVKPEEFEFTPIAEEPANEMEGEASTLSEEQEEYIRHLADEDMTLVTASDTACDELGDMDVVAGDETTPVEIHIERDDDNNLYIADSDGQDGLAIGADANSEGIDDNEETTEASLEDGSQTDYFKYGGGTGVSYWQHAVNGDETAWRDTIGSGITVAVIDTGATTSHPDITYAGAYNACSYNANSMLLAYWFGGSYNGARDNAGHGTHVAGIVGGHGKVLGVAPGARIMSIKALEDFGGTTANIVRGINMAVSKGARVVNMSFGSSQYSSLERNAIQNGVNKGVVFVASAGNDGDKGNPLNYPAAYSDLCIGVAATKKSGSSAVRDYYSQYGSYVDVAAPGTNIYSTYLGNGYRYLDGTSMAAPMVAGACALYFEQNSSLLTVKSSAVSKQVTDAIEKTAVDAGTSGRDNYYGYGLLSTKNLTNGSWDYSTFVPKFALNRKGYVQNGFEVKIVSTASYSNLYYTLDGSTPGLNSSNPNSSNKITISTNAPKVTLKARAYDTSTKKWSAITSATFTIAPETINIESLKYTHKYALPRRGATLNGSAVKSAFGSNENTYQLYKVHLDKGDQLNLSLAAGGFNGELYLLQGTTIKQSAKPNTAYKNARKISYTHNAAAADMTIVVTSGTLIDPRGLGTSDYGNYTLTSTITRAPQSIKVVLPRTSLANGKSMTATAEVTPWDTSDKKVEWKLYKGSTLCTDKKGPMINANGVVTMKGITAKTQFKVEAISKANSAIKGSTTFYAYPAVTSVYLYDNGGMRFYASEAIKSCSVEIEVGKTKTVAWKCLPEDASQELVYKSSNPAVATVDTTGKITAVKKGSAKITVTAADGSGKSAVCNVKVVKLPESIEVTKVGAEMIDGYYVIVPGKSVTVSAAVDKDASDRRVSLTLGSAYDGLSTAGNVLKASKKAEPGRTFKVDVGAASKLSVKTTLQFKVINPLAQPTVSISNKQLTKGGTATLSYGPDAYNCYTFKSSNAKVATVSDRGVVTAVGKGSAVISVTTKDGLKKSSSVKVTVVSPVTGVDIVTANYSESNKALKGKKMTLKAVITPADANNKTVQWDVSGTGAKISQSGVLSIDKNAVKDSKITVTATAKDGSNKFKSVTFVVAEPIAKMTIPTAVTEISTKAISGDFTQPSFTTTTLLDATVSRGGVASTAAAADVAWSSSNEKVATVSEGTNGKCTVTAKSKGTVTITAKATDGSGVKATKKLTVLDPIGSLTVRTKKNICDSSGKYILTSGNNNVVIKDVVAVSGGKPSFSNVMYSLNVASNVATIASNGTLKVASDLSKPTSITVTVEPYRAVTYKYAGKKYSSKMKYATYKMNAIAYPATKSVYLPYGANKRDMVVGATYTLTPSSLPLNTYGVYTYKSSKEKVATVDANGKITAIAKGKAVITVTAADGTGKKTTCTVTVH